MEIGNILGFLWEVFSFSLFPVGIYMWGRSIAGQVKTRQWGAVALAMGICVVAFVLGYFVIVKPMLPSFVAHLSELNAAINGGGYVAGASADGNGSESAPLTVSEIIGLVVIAAWLLWYVWRFVKSLRLLLRTHDRRYVKPTVVRAIGAVIPIAAIAALMLWGD